MVQRAFEDNHGVCLQKALAAVSKNVTWLRLYSTSFREKCINQTCNRRQHTFRCSYFHLLRERRMFQGNIDHHATTTCCVLTRWDRLTHICVSKLTALGSDNGLSPVWRQAIIWTNAGILWIGPKLQWNFNRNSFIFVQENALKMLSAYWRNFFSRPQWVN